jgi:fatty-acyl-CoA synthase
MPAKNSSPQTARFATLWQMLDAQAAQRGAALALRFEGQETTYAQLAQLACAMAMQLHSRGVNKGDRVAYLGLNHSLQIALLFACARIGAILVPLNYRLALPEWQAVLADCSPRLLVSDVHWQSEASQLAHRQLSHVMLPELIHGDAESEPGSVSAFGRINGEASGAVLLVYTSGTTGLPKGALHTQQNLMSNMHLAVINYALNATDLIVTVLPLFHVGGLCIQTLPALYAGACVSLHARFDAGATLRSIAHERPSLTLQVPATMRALIEHVDWAISDLSSLRAVWAGSSVLPANLVQAFHARGIPVCNVYGSTETGPFSICLNAAQARSHVGSCGWPAGDEVQVKLVNLQAGVGEICIRAPNVAERYWPDLPLKDVEGWFHTGDLARMEADGSYWVVGRAKDMLISGGENIYSAEIENLLAAQRGVLECAVVGLPDAKWGEVVAACVVLAPDEDASHAQQELSAALAGQLARYKLPRQWHFLPKLPKTALGKVQKAQLLELLSKLHES